LNAKASAVIELRIACLR